MLLLGIVLLITVVGLGASNTERRLGRRLDRMERKLDAIVAQLGVTVEEPGLAEVAALVREGKKIQAIKVYRENTGADLKEARDAVERLV
ncbi:Ribosomal protein L7/L12 C-terminal domain-containing protein [Amycolatopsis pretoriensis]|uniref:Ribosomal protein L7/L12 C-terminal domain-containing protein n=2 Tax=Amycolatopsis pretoriensis TaxID=218821 RepID=A0A1H5RJN2_9PSEU|nr:Ribosomal protein L7/L12 C-terminal domain-containing protein [Amycolatopsis pretoriensis]